MYRKSICPLLEMNMFYMSKSEPFELFPKVYVMCFLIEHRPLVYCQPCLISPGSTAYLIWLWDEFSSRSFPMAPQKPLKL